MTPSTLRHDAAAPSSAADFTAPHFSASHAGSDPAVESWSDAQQLFHESEVDLKRRVRNFLSARSEPSLRRLDVEVEGHRVVLSGRVRTFYEKQLAISCCQRVAGVLQVTDAIEVQAS